LDGTPTHEPAPLRRAAFFEQKLNLELNKTGIEKEKSAIENGQKRTTTTRTAAE
jgi:hypothetical protein